MFDFKCFLFRSRNCWTNKESSWSYTSELIQWYWWDSSFTFSMVNSRLAWLTSIYLYSFSNIHNISLVSWTEINLYIYNRNCGTNYYLKETITICGVIDYWTWIFILLYTQICLLCRKQWKGVTSLFS